MIRLLIVILSYILLSNASGMDIATHSTIKRIAIKNGVNPKLVFAIISTESSYNAAAIGDKGKSFGLFQVQCRTAKTMGFKLPCKMLLHPLINAHYGIRYLKKMLNKYPFKQAISAYNAGRPIKSNKRYVNKVLIAMAKLTSNKEETLCML